MSYHKPRPVTVEMMREAVAALPDEIRAALSAGPLPGDPCRICITLDEKWWKDSKNYDENDPRWIIFDFHDEPGRFAGDDFTDEQGRQRYELCLQVYEAAGWVSA
jgi:hypothetical protein